MDCVWCRSVRIVKKDNLFLKKSRLSRCWHFKLCFSSFDAFIFPLTLIYESLQTYDIEFLKRKMLIGFNHTWPPLVANRGKNQRGIGTRNARNRVRSQAHSQIIDFYEVWLIKPRTDFLSTIWWHIVSSLWVRFWIICNMSIWSNCVCERMGKRWMKK